MLVVPFRILFPLLVYHIHFVNVGKIGEVREKEYLLKDMRFVKNKIEESDPSLHTEVIQKEEDFVFSGDDSDYIESSGYDTDYSEFSGDDIDTIELFGNKDYDGIIGDIDYRFNDNDSGYNVTTENDPFTIDITMEKPTSCNSKYNDSASVNADLIEMLRKQQKKCVLYQNNDTSNFIIYC
ncbi:uncharacterized protein LOC108904918 [Anoplophora glabripennis]|uniref:uncharacterized protein LOC108904918 n=1 Tax=Anoplophora glabripennis TaxID=217634 RepID=UPI000873E139|nr:uncharacterized protein LOC108904918 [Anoplophora glabripennis]